MSPLIHAGDELYVEFGPREPRIGETVLFRDGDRMVAHRLVERKRTRTGELLVTRGDGSVFLDRPFPAHEVFGVVRACRRAPDGTFTKIVEGGAAAIAVARISAAMGHLMAGVERLPVALREPTGGFARRLARQLVARSVQLAALSTRGTGAALAARRPEADTGDPIVGALPKVS